MEKWIQYLILGLLFSISNEVEQFDPESAFDVIRAVGTTLAAFYCFSMSIIMAARDCIRRWKDR